MKGGIWENAMYKSVSAAFEKLLYFEPIIPNVCVCVCFPTIFNDDNNQ